MARKRNEPMPAPPDRKNNPQLRLDERFLRKLKTVCSGLGVDPKDYVQQLVEPQLDRDLPLVLRELGLGDKE